MSQILGLKQFLATIAPAKLKEYLAIGASAEYPPSKEASTDFAAPLPLPSNLPFGKPKAAEAHLRKLDLRGELWTLVCSAMETGDWTCEAFEEGAVEGTKLAAPMLRAGTIDLEGGVLLTRGKSFDSIRFSAASPQPLADQIKPIIRRYCLDHDPEHFTIPNLMTHVSDVLGYNFSRAFIIALMHKCAVDPRWFGEGRKKKK